MRIEPSNTVIQMNESNRLSFSNARNVRLECLDGVIWLTFSDIEGDFLIERGEQIVIPSNGLSLIQGLPFASVKLTSPTSKVSILRNLLNSIKSHFLTLVVA
jgi:hypothetical protein